MIQDLFGPDGIPSSPVAWRESHDLILESECEDAVNECGTFHATGDVRRVPC